MNLRQRFAQLFPLALVLGLALLGREILRSNDAEPRPASIEKVATVADTAEPAIEQPASAAAITPAPNVSSPSGTFRGRVIDARARQPVREFELEFHPQHQPKPDDQAPGARTFRAKDGRFEWQGIPPGLWLITAKTAGYQRFDLDQFLMPAGTTKEVVILLQRGHTLRGRVYDETSGDGIPEAYISVREGHVGRFEGNFRMRVNTRSGKDGSFVLEGLPAGSIILSVSAATYMGREIDAFIGEQTSPLRIGLSTGGAITGYLVAADGVTPVAGSVSLSHRDEGHGNSARTSDAGEFKFERLPAGRYQLRASSGQLYTQRELSLANQERKDGVVLALGAGRSVRGVVTGLRPADLERVQLAIYRESAGRGSERTGVNARGEFEIQGVQPGAMILTASIDRGRQISKRVQVPTDADVTANIEFPRGARLTGNVTRGGKPMSKFWLEPRALEERKLWIHGTQTSERGEYVIEDVPNGEYYVQLGSYRSRDFEVSGDTVFDIDVPTTQLSGRVVEEGGKVPMVDVDLYIWSTQPESSRAHWHERTNHSGEFALIGVEPGDYLVSAYKPGYEMYRERISYGAATDAMTIPLRQGKGVAVRLRQAGSDRPIRDVQVGESIGGRHGHGLRLRLDESGVGYIPSALAGSTLTFHARACAPAVVADWNGQELDLQLERQVE